MRRAALAIALLASFGAARAQPYPTMSSMPDPSDFVVRADNRLTLAGNPFRFAGANLDWLGVLRDGPRAAPRLATEFEVSDALTSVQDMGGVVLRAGALASSVGCPVCVEPSSGRWNADAFALIDRTLKLAHDLGLRVILPLVGPLGDCSTGPGEGAAPGDACTYVRWHDGHDARTFFTDPAIRADVVRHALAVLDHQNSLTGMRYRDDPTILAWEDCDACGAGQNAAEVWAWSQAVAAAVKAHDARHLFETGALGGELQHFLALAPKADGPVDLVGDRLLGPASQETPDAALDVAEKIGKLGYPYVFDALGWTPRLWKTTEEFSLFLGQAISTPELSGALLWRLYAHAGTGGVLAAFFGNGPDAFLYPGLGNGAVAWDDMRARARVFRRFGYQINGLKEPPMYQPPPAPIIVSVHGHELHWLGSAGSIAYDIERSANPSLPGTWTRLCRHCVADPQSTWRDPNPPAGAAWYRMFPFNLNDHAGEPSRPVPNG